MRDDAFYVGETGRRIRWTCTIFGGAYRKKSETSGLVVYLGHRRCHIFAPSAVHQSTGQMQRLKRYGQLKAMEEQRWTEEDFRREFGKSYL